MSTIPLKLTYKHSTEVLVLEYAQPEGCVRTRVKEEDYTRSGTMLFVSDHQGNMYGLENEKFDPSLNLAEKIKQLIATVRARIKAEPLPRHEQRTSTSELKEDASPETNFFCHHYGHITLHDSKVVSWTTYGAANDWDHLLLPRDKFEERASTLKTRPSSHSIASAASTSISSSIAPSISWTEQTGLYLDILIKTVSQAVEDLKEIKKPSKQVLVKLTALQRCLKDIQKNELKPEYAHIKAQARNALSLPEKGKFSVCGTRIVTEARLDKVSCPPSPRAPSIV